MATDVVHIITGLDRGGAERALFGLVSAEVDVTSVKVVSLTTIGVYGPKLEAAGVAVVCLNMGRIFPSPLKVLRLAMLLRRWKPRVVQTWMYHADLIGGAAARICGIPVCWGIRNCEISAADVGRVTRFVVRACAALSGLIPSRAVACSARAAAVHQSFGYNVTMAVVGNGVDLDEWRPRSGDASTVRSELGLEDGDFVFAHAARADPVKNHRGLALAFSEAFARQPNLRLLLCGDGLLEGDAYFESLPFSLEAREAVLALGPRDDLSRLWNAADSFVLTSVSESFPNVIAEAMACGLPCLSTDVGDVREMIGEAGVVVPVGESSKIADAMVGLSRLSQSELAKLSRSAHERAMCRFTFGQMTSGYRDVWNEIAPRRFN